MIELAVGEILCVELMVIDRVGKTSALVRVILICCVDDCNGYGVCAGDCGVCECDF